MTEKSFYDLDYIIDINEKRVEQFTSAYFKVLERFTNLILIYSAITIFLISILQDIFWAGNVNWVMITFFIAFCILILVSVYFTIRMIIPVEVAYLDDPKKYYDELRLEYEAKNIPVDEIKNLLKASYISELEKGVETNSRVFRRKSSFYYNALIFGLLAVLPYLVCLGFHISKKDDKVQKVELVNAQKKS